jgi:hypothetical protein
MAQVDVDTLQLNWSDKALALLGFVGNVAAVGTVPLVPAVFAVAGILLMLRINSPQEYLRYNRLAAPVVAASVVLMLLQTWFAYRQLEEFSPDRITAGRVVRRAWTLPLFCNDEVGQGLKDSDDDKGNIRA